MVKRLLFAIKNALNADYYVREVIYISIKEQLDIKEKSNYDVQA